MWTKIGSVVQTKNDKVHTHTLPKVHTHTLPITKATNTLSENVMLVTFPLQQRLHERVSMLLCTYTASLVSCVSFLYSFAVCVCLSVVCVIGHLAFDSDTYYYYYYYYCYYYYYYYYYTIWMSLSQAFLPGTSLESAVIPTAQASSFTLQYFPYYVLCSKYSCFFVVNLSNVFLV